MLTVEEITTYALGEHDPGSAQNGRTTNKMWSPAPTISFTGPPAISFFITERELI